ncbi:MAG: porin [Qingshengfaniella sp.]
MKKVLLASTALVFGAGVAAADVTVSGDARMGIVYGEDMFTNANKAAAGKDSDEDYNFNSRFRIRFDATGETDGGLAFGGWMRAHEAGDAATGGVDSGTDGVVFISGEFGKLEMGDVNGAAELVVGDLSFDSLTGLNDYDEITYLIGSNSRNPVARYIYTVNGLTMSLGMTDNEEYSVGAGYDGGMWSVGLGYEKVSEGASVSVDMGDENITFATVNQDWEQILGAVSVTFSDITLKGIYGYAEGEDDGEVHQYGVSAEGTWDALTLSAFYRKVDGDDGVTFSDNDDKKDAYGIGAIYDLGGGAALAGGIISVDNDEMADFGVKFTF